MARHEVFGHKLPLSLADYQRMTALLARDTSPGGLRNAALLAVWYDSLLRIEDLCGLSVGTSWRIEVRFANLAPCLVGMEGCVGAHHLVGA
jgi:hypothetical protein